MHTDMNQLLDSLYSNNILFNITKWNKNNLWWYFKNEIYTESKIKLKFAGVVSKEYACASEKWYNW